MELHPRKCKNCGEGMSIGYLLYDAITLCSDDCLTEYLFRQDDYYYTEWEDDEEIMYTTEGKAFNVKELKKEK